MDNTAKKIIPLDNFSRGSDELNFCEFPLTALSKRVPADQKTLVFKDQIFDQSTRALVERTLTIAASEGYGLPTALDDEVIVGLIQLTHRKGFSNRTVSFTRYELIKLLGWDDSSKNYKRIEESLKRWVGVTLYWDNAWWSKEEQAWVSEHFHIIDNVTLLDRQRQSNRRARNPEDKEALKSTFTWNDVVFRSFEAGNLKTLDLKTYTSLKRPIAKRIYRFLDKRFYRKPTYSYDLRSFACEKVGLSSKYNIAQIKRKLKPALLDLEEIGFLSPMEDSERFQKEGRGLWKVVFTKGDNATKEKRAKPILSELLSFGITKKRAERFLLEHSEEYLREKIALLKEVSKKEAPTNPAGFLVKAIEDDYSFKAKKAPKRKPARVVPIVKEAKEESPELTDKEKEAALSRGLEKASPFLKKQYEDSKEKGGSLYQAVCERLIEEGESLAPYGLR